VKVLKVACGTSGSRGTQFWYHWSTASSSSTRSIRDMARHEVLDSSIKRLGQVTYARLNWRAELRHTLRRSIFRPNFHDNYVRTLQLYRPHTKPKLKRLLLTQLLLRLSLTSPSCSFLFFLFFFFFFFLLLYLLFYYFSLLFFFFLLLFYRPLPSYYSLLG
jgi:hypothetical protein